jgi:hypothetical protein
MPSEVTYNNLGVGIVNRVDAVSQQGFFGARHGVEQARTVGLPILPLQHLIFSE